MTMMKIDRLVEMSSQFDIRDNELLISDRRMNQLVEQFGSPLYLYSEEVIRKSCRRLKETMCFPDLNLHYSAKANSNISILGIIREEGFGMDAVSPAEIVMGLKAGFSPEQVMFVSNNVSRDEFDVAVKNHIDISVNSLGQLELFGKHFPGKRVAVRINPGIGAGHHQKVITGGTKTKFGVDLTQLDAIKAIAAQYSLRICGLNIHIGSNFLDYESYITAAAVLCKVAEGFEDLEFIDFGGGLGISYKGEAEPLDVKGLGRAMERICRDFTKKYGRRVRFIIEPGRYPVAESGLLMTTVTDVQRNPQRSFIGTDAGFNVFLRPALYNAQHEIINCSNVKGKLENYDICGNICETGDILAEGAPMPPTETTDILAVLDVGAYGYAMASNYNCRLRPAEVLLQMNGEFRLIRKRDRLEDLFENQIAA